jgi:hypothetical protein
MKNYTFHWEVRTILAQFEDAFSNIVVKRYNQDREPEDQIAVNFRYAPKSRTLMELQQLNQNIKLPIVAITTGGIRRNNNRVFNKIEGAWFTDTRSAQTSGWAHLLQPVPVDITVNMSIIGRFQSDIDQIITNFVPYCDPYIVVSWKWPYTIPWANFEIRSHVKWNEDISFQYPTDISNTQPYRVIADTSFTIESWMFKNQPPDGKSIYVIDTSFTAVSAMERFEAMKSRKDEYITDYDTNYTVVSARPQLTLCTPFISYVSGGSKFTGTGFMMDYTDRVFLSASDFTMFDTASTTPLSAGVTYNDLFSAYPYTSGTYVPFNGIEVAKSAWTVYDKNTILFTIAPVASGIFDIILVNEAGYGQLTKDSIRNNRDTFEYPCVSGIQIL